MPEGDQSYDKESVNFWVEPEQKERWEAYLEEQGEFQYLSQLVRHAVEREIQRSSGNDSVELSENVAGRFDDLQGSIDQVEQVMQEVESRLSGLEREVRDDPKVRQLANEVFQTLPTRSDIKDYECYVAGDTTAEENVSPANAGSVEGLAEALDKEPRRVKAALDRLQQDTHQVHTMDWDGETRYFRED